MEHTPRIVKWKTSNSRNRMSDTRISLLNDMDVESNFDL